MWTAASRSPIGDPQTGSRQRLTDLGGESRLRERGTRLVDPHRWRRRPLRATSRRDRCGGRTFDGVADEPPQTHPAIGGVIKTRLGEDAGDRGARAMYRPHPEVAERLGIVVLGRLPSPGLPCGVVVDVPELGQQGRTDQAALNFNSSQSARCLRSPPRVSADRPRCNFRPSESTSQHFQANVRRLRSRVMRGGLDLVAVLENGDVPLWRSSGREPGRARQR